MEGFLDSPSQSYKSDTTTKTKNLAKKIKRDNSITVPQCLYRLHSTSEKGKQDKKQPDISPSLLLIHSSK